MFWSVIIIGAVVLLSSSAASQQLQYGAECQTPDSATGFCIELLQCQSLLHLLINVTSNADDRAFLRTSRCGGSGLNIFVCCPTTELKKDINRRAARLLPAPEDCRQYEPRLVYGLQPTSPDDFPWNVQLWFVNVTSNKEITLCNGALINHNHVVTAAHCVDKKNLENKGLQLDKVRLGEWNTSSTTDCDEFGDCGGPIVNISVAAVFRHENYDPNSSSQENDIALIRLSEKVNYTDFIRPICLRTNDIGVKLFTLSGWMRNSSGVESDVKLKATIYPTGDHDCAETYRPLDVTIGPHHICASGNVRSTNSSTLLMFANGGNRLSKVWYLAGIGSFDADNYNSSVNDLPNVYTRVSKYYDWILMQIQ